MSPEFHTHKSHYPQSDSYTVLLYPRCSPQQYSHYLSPRFPQYLHGQCFRHLTVAAWCREHQISVATYYYWRKRVSANDEMLSVKEPVFAELTNIRKAALSEEKKPLLISFNQLQLAVSTPAQAELAAVLISRMQSLC